MSVRYKWSGDLHPAQSRISVGRSRNRAAIVPESSTCYFTMSSLVVLFHSAHERGNKPIVLELYQKEMMQS